MIIIFGDLKKQNLTHIIIIIITEMRAANVAIHKTHMTNAYCLIIYANAWLNPL